ncbi:hypothetical protein PPL_03895 [Heterostelium album PN500]|uniref:Uncharacterized protein n=1 Tax=Heterostelium pallidum (strain ATCC 26659 / Pp 5 / PN500) TaxID=670386 RepID=D3B5F7_HETP5|nr:hypothetical protein PPL_03895 [Heterostelium album PN500]EFA83105.1 hypothetical protein PPL_03895 [Heterostelium album PN500]|eukprot:XP_020435222.1 hypothetical protein PPL_03895 [Heterostelium album PN500]
MVDIDLYRLVNNKYCILRYSRTIALKISATYQLLDFEYQPFMSLFSQALEIFDRAIIGCYYRNNAKLVEGIAGALNQHNKPIGVIISSNQLLNRLKVPIISFSLFDMSHLFEPPIGTYLEPEEEEENYSKKVPIDKIWNERLESIECGVTLPLDISHIPRASTQSICSFSLISYGFEIQDSIIKYLQLCNRLCKVKFSMVSDSDILSILLFINTSQTLKTVSVGFNAEDATLSPILLNSNITKLVIFDHKYSHTLETSSILTQYTQQFKSQQPSEMINRSLRKLVINERNELQTDLDKYTIMLNPTKYLVNLQHLEIPMLAGTHQNQWIKTLGSSQLSLFSLKLTAPITIENATTDLLFNQLFNIDNNNNNKNRQRSLTINETICSSISDIEHFMKLLQSNNHSIDTISIEVKDDMEKPSLVNMLWQQSSQYIHSKTKNVEFINLSTTYHFSKINRH